ncbi:hypothetical protein JL09_g6121 [Pichia kudriavzevii]|uniref:Uncharacterized protein n=1 Tax=Pichia kudriavzevii TaxID=4909 RepID=A0A099NQB6_PICKU|nr:hypothetical protein JL09_g6121 [Pichia kudriavzevii]
MRNRMDVKTLKPRLR